MRCVNPPPLASSAEHKNAGLAAENKHRKKVEAMPVILPKAKKLGPSELTFEEMKAVR